MTTSPDTHTDPQSPAAAPDLDRTLARVINRLQREYAHTDRPTSWAAASMAALRTATPGAIDASPASWETLYAAVPEDAFGWGEAVSCEERATHAALVLYAVHQTSQPMPMHRPGVRLGQALRHLPEAQDEASPILRRFTSLVSSSTFEATVYHLRSLITLLRREGIGLDYVRLASDLTRCQRPGAAPTVRRQWGRDYFGGRGLDPRPQEGESEGAVERPAIDD